MILVAGHHIKRHPGPRLLYHIHQIFNQPLKNKDLLRQSDIVYALWLV